MCARSLQALSGFEIDARSVGVLIRLTVSVTRDQLCVSNKIGGALLSGRCADCIISE
jgi:hypothetical protein